MNDSFPERIDQIEKRKIVFRVVSFNVEPTHIDIKFLRILPHYLLDFSYIETQVSIQIGTLANTFIPRHHRKTGFPPQSRTRSIPTCRTVTKRLLSMSANAIAVCNLHAAPESRKHFNRT
nr:hypothetical protein [Burkholderia cepacia]